MALRGGDGFRAHVAMIRLSCCRPYRPHDRPAKPSRRARSHRRSYTTLRDTIHVRGDRLSYLEEPWRTEGLGPICAEHSHSSGTCSNRPLQSRQACGPKCSAPCVERRSNFRRLCARPSRTRPGIRSVYPHRRKTCGRSYGGPEYRKCAGILVWIRVGLAHDRNGRLGVRW